MREMTKLNQIVALEKGLKGRVKEATTRIYHLLQKGDSFAGLTRTYQPKDEEGEQIPSERKLVQATVMGQLGEAAEKLANLFDVVATKEWGNTHATADVKIGDKVIVESAPVPYLLFLEKELTDWRTMVTKIPTLSLEQTWVFDEGNQQYRAEPTQTIRTKKVPKVLEMAKATDKHPAQVQVYNEDVPVGVWTQTLFSGAVPAKQRAALIERANLLIDAVKTAREEANSAEISQQAVSAPVFAYLLQG